MTTTTVPASRAQLFSAHLPSWWRQMKVEAHSKVAANPLTLGCRSGDPAYLAAFLLGFWPFVNTFPDLIRRSFQRLEGDMVMEWPARFLKRAGGILTGIEHDERSHRRMFLLTAATVGLTERDLEQAAPVDLVAEVSATIAESTNLCEMFLRFAAVEIEAQAFSEELLASSRFRNDLNPDALRWFQEHAEHHTTPHEALAFNLASACHGAAVTQADAAGVIADLIHLFGSAAEMSVRMFVPLSQRIHLLGY